MVAWSSSAAVPLLGSFFAIRAQPAQRYDGDFASALRDTAHHTRTRINTGTHTRLAQTHVPIIMTNAKTLLALAILGACACAVSAHEFPGAAAGNNLRVRRLSVCSCKCPWYNPWCSCNSHKQVTSRPSCRPQTLCRTWWKPCPSGYRWRDVTSGPSCDRWYHAIGKCSDETVYTGESCGYGGRNCVGGLTCPDATPRVCQA